MSRSCEDQRLLPIHRPHADRHPNATEIANSGGVGFIYNWVACGDAHATERVNDLAEAAKVHHDGIFDTNAVELAEEFAQGWSWAVREGVGVPFSGAVVRVDLVTVGCAVESARVRWDWHINRVARDAEHADGAFRWVNACDNERVGIETGLALPLVYSNQQNVESLRPIPAGRLTTARRCTSVTRSAEDAADECRCGRNISAGEEVDPEADGECRCEANTREEEWTHSCAARQCTAPCVNGRRNAPGCGEQVEDACSTETDR